LAKNQNCLVNAIIVGDALLRLASSDDVMLFDDWLLYDRAGTGVTISA